MTVSTLTFQTRGTKTVWDVRDLVTSIKWTTDLNYSAGSLELELIEVDEGFTPKNGDIVRFKWSSKKVFYGFVFDVKYTNEKFTVTVYDTMRYLKNQDSLVWSVSTLSQRFDKVTKMAGIKHKVVSGSSHKLVAEVADGKSYFDMLKTAITATKRATGDQYFIADNYGVVELRKAPYKKLKIIVGDKSLMTKFDFEKSIEDAANVVRVVREDKKKKQRITKTAKGKTSKRTVTSDDPKDTTLVSASASGHSMDRWGKLQIVEKAKDKANEAQMKARAEQLLKSKNKQTYTLTLTAIGDLSLVAGNACYVKIKSLKDIGLGTKSLLITKATHTFMPAYTVELEMKVKI